MPNPKKDPFEDKDYKDAVEHLEALWSCEVRGEPLPGLDPEELKNIPEVHVDFARLMKETFGEAPKEEEPVKYEVQPLVRDMQLDPRKSAIARASAGGNKDWSLVKYREMMFLK